MALRPGSAFDDPHDSPDRLGNKLFRALGTNQRRCHLDRLRTRFNSFARPLLLRRGGRVRLPPLAMRRVGDRGPAGMRVRGDL